jgi:hypothetical protein
MPPKPAAMTKGCSVLPHRSTSFIIALVVETNRIAAAPIQKTTWALLRDTSSGFVERARYRRAMSTPTKSPSSVMWNGLRNT